MSMLEHAKLPQPRKLPDGDEVYVRDVLCLADGEAEESLNSRLKLEAENWGINVERQAAHQQDRPPAKSLSSDLSRRSQESVASRTSQSTGLMSTFSDVSRDHHHPHSTSRSQASLSLRDYDAFIARGLFHGRLSMSSPPTTPSQSILSLPLSSPESSPKRHFRRIRGLSILKLHRTDSGASLNDNCPHCRQDPPSKRRAVHKLPCGHKLCTQALRNNIKSATESKPDAVPSCCGMPIPGKLVEHVTSQVEQSALLEKLEQSDRPPSRAPSVNSEPRPSVASQRPDALSLASRATSGESEVDPIAPRVREELDRVMEQHSFHQLRQEQAELRDRFTAWIGKQRAALETQHERLRSTFRASQENEIDGLLERHGATMSEAEDRQVKAEAAMRDMHEQEKRDNATALKHMEAYCAGTYGTGEPHNRVVTEQDRAELEKARRARDQMNAKHESAINVLRGEQSRRMKLRSQKQDKEVQELRRVQRREELELERTCSQEIHELNDSVSEKEARIRSRWLLQGAIFGKRFEQETGTIVDGGLPPVEWHTASANVEMSEQTSGLEMDMKKVGISTGIAMSG